MSMNDPFLLKTKLNIAFNFTIITIASKFNLMTVAVNTTCGINFAKYINPKWPPNTNKHFLKQS